MTVFRPPTISSLKIADRFYALVRLWNQQLPHLFRQPHQYVMIHCLTHFVKSSPFLALDYCFTLSLQTHSKPTFSTNLPTILDFWYRRTAFIDNCTGPIMLICLFLVHFSSIFLFNSMW